MQCNNTLKRNIPMEYNYQLLDHSNWTNVIDNQKILKNYDVSIILAHAFQISIIGRKVLIESLPLMVIIIYCVFAIDAVHKVSGFNNNFKV